MRRCIAAVLLISSLFLAGCDFPLFLAFVLNDSKVPQEEIVAYVNDNYEVLEAIPYDDMPQLPPSYDGVNYKPYSDDEGRSFGEAIADFTKEHLGSNTIAAGMYAYNENNIVFDCGASGPPSHSISVGFYFSRDDTPFALQFDGVQLTETKPGVFEWQNEDGRYAVYTEKIRDNWYYYRIKMF